MSSTKQLRSPVDDYSEMRSYALSTAVADLEGHSRCLINPYSTGMQAWDVILIIGLVYTSLVTPFDSAFLNISVGDVVFFMNLVVDLIFVIDIFVTFQLPYADPVTGLWIRSRSKIARRYLRGWFFIDVVSVLPFDWILIAVYGDEIDAQAVRALRLLKLLKIARILRGNRIYKRWRDRVGANLTLLAMYFYIGFTLLMAHWVACILGVIPFIEGSTATPEMLESGERPFNWQTEYFEGTLRYEPGEYGIWTIYLGSMYWSIMTITTIGFGDVSPKTDVERIFMSVLMFFGASLQAYLIGTICGLVAELAEEKTQFRITMNSLNEYMSTYDFPDELRVRLRKYFAYSHAVKDSNRYAHLTAQMSPHLQSEVSLIVNSVWVKQVAFIEMADPSEMDALVLALSKRLRIEVYAPLERVVSTGDDVTRLYIISKGLVVLHLASDAQDSTHEQVEVGNMQVRLSVSENVRSELIRGQCFGHELIYTGFKSLYNCTTLQFSELHMLSKVALDETLEKFPLTEQAISSYTEAKRAQY